MGIFQKLRNAKKQRALQQETDFYRCAFNDRNLTTPAETDIYQQIKTSFPEKQIKNKGSLSILAIYHDYNWEGLSLGPSLARFGNVQHLDWHEFQSADGLGFVEAAIELNKTHQFDVIFTYLSGEQVTPNAMRTLRSINVPIVNLALNDKESFVGKVKNHRVGGMRDICCYFDLCWTSTEDAIVKYVVEGATPIYLPEGANPFIHKPYDEEKIYDVTFVGQCYGNRPEIISRLRSVGVNVQAFGPGWPSGPLSSEEMIRTWSRSHINLGFGGVLGHKEIFCLKGRDFEVPMSGGLYLTEYHDEISPFYLNGSEIVTYRNFSDLVEKIKWLLANPSDAEAIRQRGRARALKEHSWEMRFEKVFKLLGVIG
jgi:hypothetical protein